MKGILNYIKKWFGRKALYPILFALLLMINKSVLNGMLTDDQLGDLALLILAFILGEAGIDAIRIYVQGKKTQ